MENFLCQKNTHKQKHFRIIKVTAEVLANAYWLFACFHGISLSDEVVSEKSPFFRLAASWPV